ncbi:MAG: hypothetical protein AAF722_07835 [Cyanobacteria bacterium P01_C01_bin.70]
MVESFSKGNLESLGLDVGQEFEPLSKLKSAIQSLSCAQSGGVEAIAAAMRSVNYAPSIFGAGLRRRRQA